MRVCLGLSYRNFILQRFDIDSQEGSLVFFVTLWTRHLHSSVRTIHVSWTWKRTWMTVFASSQQTSNFPVCMDFIRPALHDSRFRIIFFFIWGRSHPGPETTQPSAINQRLLRKHEYSPTFWCVCGSFTPTRQVVGECLWQGNMFHANPLVTKAITGGGGWGGYTNLFLTNFTRQQPETFSNHLPIDKGIHLFPKDRWLPGGGSIGMCDRAHILSVHPLSETSCFLYL